MIQSEESNLVDDDDNNDIVVFQRKLCYEKNRISSSNKQVKS